VRQTRHGFRSFLPEILRAPVRAMARRFRPREPAGQIQAAE